MEEILKRFEPVYGNSSFMLWGTIVAGLLFFGLCAWLLFKKEEGQKRQLNIILAMLFFFFGMISLGTSFFTFWTQQKTGPVIVFTDAVETVYGRVSFDQLKNASITTMGNQSRINPQQQRGGSRLLLLEEDNGKAHVLSEDNYDIQQIYNAIKSAVKKWEEENK